MKTSEHNSFAAGILNINIRILWHEDQSEKIVLFYGTK